MIKLVGAELLAKLAQMKDCSKSEQAKAAGYIRELEDGTQKADLTSFYSAILDAEVQGLDSQQKADSENSDSELDSNSVEYWKSLNQDSLETVLSIGMLVPPPELIPDFATSTNSSIRASIAELSDTPEDVLRRLVEDHDSDVRDAAAISLAKKLIGQELDSSSLQTFLTHQHLDHNLANQIFELNSNEVKLPLAGNLSLSDGLLAGWLDTDIDDWLKDVIEENLAKRRLPDLFRDIDEPAVTRLIANVFPDDEILKNLIVIYRESAPHPQESLCLYLSESKYVSPVIQAYLIAKCDVHVRRALALNPVATKESLDELSRDADPDVRKAVTANVNVTSDQLELLAQDSVKSVRASASLRLLPAEWQNLSNESLRAKLKTEAITDDIFEMFISENDSGILISIAGNPCISEKVQKVLSDDFDPRVISELVSNPAITEAALKHISKSWSDDQMVQAAISKRLLPVEILRLKESDLIEEIRNGKVAISTLLSLFAVSSRSVRQAILNCDSLNDSDRKLVLDEYYSRIYPADWPEGRLFTEVNKKGWIIMAASSYIAGSNDASISESAKFDIAETSRKLITLASEAESCWSSSFVYEGYHACSPVFYVVDPCGDCLLSLVDRDKHEEGLRSMLSCDLDEILELARSNNLDRVFSCVAFTYLDDDANIEVADLQRELSVDDNRPFVNFPSLSKQFDDGLEIYFKPHPSQGDSKTVSRLSWEDGVLEEEDEVPNRMSAQLKEVPLGNPFEIFYI